MANRFGGRHQAVSGALILLAGAVDLHCGARSSLPVLTPCVHMGASRACTNDCGDGDQTCQDGFWQPCVVPVATRTCTGVCGDGEQTCQDGQWLTCKVPVATRSCTNTCGDGQQTCADDVWQTDCTVPDVTAPCSSVCGDGHKVCTGGAWQPCDAPLPKPPVLHTIVRDSHAYPAAPDFEQPLEGENLDPGVVDSTLGADDTPVYAPGPNGTTYTTHGESYFYTWYHDVAGVNMSMPIDIPLTPSPTQAGFYGYDNFSFFPIDNQLFGNEGQPHNYHFTLATHTTFKYMGGEIFSFSGDDDVWVFINRKKAIDLGGIHSSLTATVNLDRQANALGLVKGQLFPLHLFFAERHTTGSDFSIHTSIADVGSCE